MELGGLCFCYGFCLCSSFCCSFCCLLATPFWRSLKGRWQWQRKAARKGNLWLGIKRNLIDSPWLGLSTCVLPFPISHFPFTVYRLPFTVTTPPLALTQTQFPYAYCLYKRTVRKIVPRRIIKALDQWVKDAQKYARIFFVINRHFHKWFRNNALCLDFLVSSGVINTIP